MLENIISDIDSIMGRIRTHPEYSTSVRRTYLAGLRDEVNKHSFYLEFNKKNGRMKEVTKSCYFNLERARKFLAENGIKHYTLSQLGHIVQPEDSEGKPTSNAYRMTEVGYGEFAGAPKEHIHHMVDDLIFFLTKDVRSHPIIRAIEAHLRIVQIHPYIDGNGRVARLLEGFCLEERDYPPAIIGEKERPEYINLITQAITDRVNHKSSIETPSPAENNFRVYIANKILQSSTKLEKELKRKRVYQAKLARLSDKGIVYSITNSLKGMVNKRGRGITISMHRTNCKEASLRIEGNCSLAELLEFFKKKKRKYNFTYSVKSITNHE